MPPRSRSFGITVTVILAFAVLFPMVRAAVVPLPSRPEVTFPTPPPGTLTIYVVDWGYHTSILVPQPDNLGARSAQEGTRTVRRLRMG